MFGIFKKRPLKMFKVNYIVGQTTTDVAIIFKREYMEYKHVEAHDSYEALDIFIREMVTYIGNMYIYQIEEINPLKERKQ